MSVTTLLSANKWIILNRIICFRYQLSKPYNCVETLVILQCKEVSSNSFKNKITKYSVTSHTYSLV